MSSFNRMPITLQLTVYDELVAEWLMSWTKLWAFTFLSKLISYLLFYCHHSDTSHFNTVDYLFIICLYLLNWWNDSPISCCHSFVEGQPYFLLPFFCRRAVLFLVTILSYNAHVKVTTLLFPFVIFGGLY